MINIFALKKCSTDFITNAKHIEHKILYINVYIHGTQYSLGEQMYALERHKYNKSPRIFIFSESQWTWSEDYNYHKNKLENDQKPIE